MEKSSKTYKITYKTYHNERLKKSRFHTKLIYPLYVQIIFDRIPITFKSYYYDLFSKPRYAIRVAGQVHTPDVNEIVRKEEALIEFIIEKNRDSFSIELFKKEYAYYCRDLLDLMEEDFITYLFTFLHDEGLPFLADTIKKGSSDCKAYEIVRDMKRVFQQERYKKLIENSFHFAPPYLPLYAFTETPQAMPLRSFTVMEWEQPDVSERFLSFLTKFYHGRDVTGGMSLIKKIIGKP